MTMIRIGKIIINFDTVTSVVPGIEPGSLIVRFINDQTQSFTGDEADGLLAFLEKTVRTASKPLDDFIVS